MQFQRSKFISEIDYKFCLYGCWNDELPKSSNVLIKNIVTVNMLIPVGSTGTSTATPPTSSVAVAIPTCLPTSSQSATANTLVAILHDYTKNQVSTEADPTVTVLRFIDRSLFFSLLTMSRLTSRLLQSKSSTHTAQSTHVPVSPLIHRQGIIISFACRHHSILS